MTTYVFVGDRRALDAWMLRQEIDQSEHGKSVKWARNGPNRLRLDDAPFMVVDEDDWYEKTIWDEMTVHSAGRLNGVYKAQLKQAKGVRT